MAKEWNTELDAQTKHDLKEIAKKTVTYKQSYKSADNPATAQLWIALMEICRSLKNLEARMESLEKLHFKNKDKGDITKDLEKW
ncbi:MAG: hypothetical protein U9P44_01765 [archaeon]|nr:hypothetical protein [archaeon]